MIVSDARALLDQAPADDQPSSINNSFPRKHLVQLIRNCLADKQPDDRLSPILETRVMQAYHDCPYRGNPPCGKGCCHGNTPR